MFFFDELRISSKLSNCIFISDLLGMSSHLVCDPLLCPGFLRAVPHVFLADVTSCPENIHKMTVTPCMACFAKCYICVFEKNIIQLLISLAEVITEILYFVTDCSLVL